MLIKGNQRKLNYTTITEIRPHCPPDKNERKNIVRSWREILWYLKMCFLRMPVISSTILKVRNKYTVLK